MDNQKIVSNITLCLLDSFNLNKNEKQEVINKIIDITKNLSEVDKNNHFENEIQLNDFIDNLQN